jgi:hypothetical protein
MKGYHWQAERLQMAQVQSLAVLCHQLRCSLLELDLAAPSKALSLERYAQKRELATVILADKSRVPVMLVRLHSLINVVD